MTDYFEQFGVVNFVPKISDLNIGGCLFPLGATGCLMCVELSSTLERFGPFD
jgi:hypothetical protein